MKELYKKYRDALFEVCELFSTSNKWGEFFHDVRTRTFKFPSKWLEHLDQEFIHGLLESFCNLQKRCGGTPPEELPDMSFEEFELRALIVRAKLANVLLHSEIEDFTEDRFVQALSVFWDDLEP